MSNIIGSGISIRPFLTKAKFSLACFSEKLASPKFNYSTYDKEFYAIIQTLMC